MTSWVGGKLDDLKQKADNAFLDDTKKDIKDIQTVLEGGPPRQPPDFEKDKGKFRKGVDLSTPDGGDPSAPSTPNDPKNGGALLSGKVNVGKRIELIHYGNVHRDVASNFVCAAPLDDTDGTLDLSAVRGGRAVAFRAALQRETILLGWFAQAVLHALQEKEGAEGNTTTLLDTVADLVGGSARQTKDTAGSADMAPFIDKLNAIWSDLDTDEIAYVDLHTAGMKLHKLRAGLLAYLLDLTDPNKPPPDANAKGTLSGLPLVGKIPLPGVIGDAVGFMQKITGKIFDVQMKLCFGLILAMRDPIEKACNDLAVDSILKRRAAIYPVWYQPILDSGDAPADPTFAAMQNPLQAQDLLSKIKPVTDAVSDVGTAVSGANQFLNDKVQKPMEIIDFLSNPVTDAPGNQFIADAFQASLGKGQGLPVFQGSEALAELAVSLICTSIVKDVPDVMKGPVGEVAREIFRVAVEFLHGVYAVLCTYPSVIVDTDKMLAAGRKHILQEIVNAATKKLKLDQLLADHTIPLPQPPFLPAGINWPQNKNLSLAPILAKLEDILEDKLQPYLEPIIDYAMSGLAARLTGARTWAGQNALTMEVHLGQLPVEIALLFRSLFGPLWSFITDTLMHALSDAVAEIMGPAATGLGYAQTAVGKASWLIADAEAKAKHARDFADNVENKARDLVSKLSSVTVGLGNTRDLKNISNAASALQNAVGADILGPDAPSDDDKKKDKKPPPIVLFDPSSRKTKGKGNKVDPADITKDAQWDTAEPVSASAAPAAGGAP